MKIFPQFLIDAAKEDGNVSSSRIMAMGTVAATVILPSTVWAFTSLVAQELVDFPSTFTLFMGAASGIVCAMFAANKRRET